MKSSTRVARSRVSLCRYTCHWYQTYILINSAALHVHNVLCTMFCRFTVPCCIVTATSSAHFDEPFITSELAIIIIIIIYLP